MIYFLGVSIAMQEINAKKEKLYTITTAFFLRGVSYIVPVLTKVDIL